MSHALHDVPLEALVAELAARSKAAAPAERPLLSFVSPCFNEAENIEALVTRIAAACKAAGIERWESILVENGSVDGSAALMERLHASEPRVRMVQLSRNFGYQGAITCGLAHARGEFVAVLDGDLQDPPELVPKFLDKANEGFDVVYGVRKKRQEGPAKRFAYWAFYRLWKATSDVQVPLDAGDFCVMRRNVVDVLVSLPEKQRFQRGLRAWSGFRQTGYEYERDARAAGETKFNLRGMVALALDGLIAYSVVPLRMMMLLGAVITFGALALSVAQGVARVLAYAGMAVVPGFLPPGLTQINLLLTSLIGFNTLCIGVVGEYVGRIYAEVKQRPVYVVKRTLP